MEQEHDRPAVRKSRFSSAAEPCAVLLAPTEAQDPMATLAEQHGQASSLAEEEWTARFHLRLHRALERNFAYIRALDSAPRKPSAPPPPPPPPPQSQKPSTTAPAAHDPQSSVYVSRLPSYFETDDLRVLFERLGAIRHVKLYSDNSGNKKGDGLVTFASASTADVCIRLFDNKDVGEGHRISVARASFNQQPQPQPQQQQQPQHGENQLDDFFNSLL